MQKECSKREQGYSGKSGKKATITQNVCFIPFNFKENRIKIAHTVKISYLMVLYNILSSFLEKYLKYNLLSEIFEI